MSNEADYPRASTPVERARDTAVRIDSQPALLAFARRVRGRMPGDDRYGDRISTAERKPVDVVARSVSGLQPDRPSVVHELGLSALQLWQSLSEKSGRGRGDREVALLFTDLVGFSSWALKAGDEAAVELLREVGEAVETAVITCGGRIVKRLGDGAMAAFDHPQHAIDAALDAQDALASIEVAGHAPRMRAGVHWGRPRRLGGDYLGVDANVAARVADAAKARQVLASEATCELLDRERVVIGRAKKLRAAGAPAQTRVCEVKRAQPDPV